MMNTYNLDNISHQLTYIFEDDRSTVVMSDNDDDISDVSTVLMSDEEFYIPDNDRYDKVQSIREMIEFVDETTFIDACIRGDANVIFDLIGLRGFNTLSQDVIHRGISIAARNHHYDVTGMLFPFDISGIFDIHDAEFIKLAEKYYNDHINFLNNTAHCLGNNTDIVPYIHNEFVTITKGFEATIFVDEKRIVYESPNDNISTNISDVIIFCDLPFLGIGISETIEVSQRKIVFRGRIIEYKTSRLWTQCFRELKEWDIHTVKGILRRAIPNLGTEK